MFSLMVRGRGWGVMKILDILQENGRYYCHHFFREMSSTQCYGPSDVEGMLKLDTMQRWIILRSSKDASVSGLAHFRTHGHGGNVSMGYNRLHGLERLIFKEFVFELIVQ